MLKRSRINVVASIVGNPSLIVEERVVELRNEWLVDAHKLMTDLASFCDGQPLRVYWPISQRNYLPISGYMGSKAALNTMHVQPRLCVVTDEPSFMLTEFSEEIIDESEKRARARFFVDNGQYDDQYDVSSLLRNDSTECTRLTDLEILRCAFGCRGGNEKSSYEKSSGQRRRETYAREYAKREFDVLMKGFPEAKAIPRVEAPPAETKKINSAGTSSSVRKKSHDFKTGGVKDVKALSGREPKQRRSEGRLDEIVNTWRDVKRALSLLCVKTFSSKAAMLEAPPGSREDLVEAARTPCTPTDLDTMLYGYTNSIYVLDHTPESLPDMDMLQLFASPAGRALVTGDNRSTTTTTTTTRRGSTSASLSRESSLRGKNPRRRISSTVSLPAPPPRQRKSSAELYKEAVEILGLTCSLTDSCRCLDCQSNYFDCDDDCGEARTELAAGTPILLDHALTHPLTCSIQ